MLFRTELTICEPEPFMDHSRSGFLAGSCFAENIVQKLRAAKFSVMSNPFGVLFNPMSICDMILALSGGKVFGADDLVFDGELWFGWHHHGSFSGADKDSVLRNMNAAAAEGAAALRKASYVILTFGTAWIYRLASSGAVVANCHKQPSTLFTRHRLTVKEIVSACSELLDGPLKNKRVIFTISPVRHLKDGFAENSLSKSTLRLAIDELTCKYDNTAYFPAWEIVTDDLRDYRFYGPDMVHPSAVAVEYVWEKFADYSMTAETKALLPRLDKLSRAMEHRILNPLSDASRAFGRRLYLFVDELHRDMPQVDFSAELDYFAKMQGSV